MKQHIRKNVSRVAHAPMEQLRRRQAEQASIATLGLHLPVAYQDTLGSQPSLQKTIDFLRTKPDGDHYLADVARLPARFAMARRAIRAISSQDAQLIATAEVVTLHNDNSGVLESFWKRRLRRRIAKVATRMVSATDDPDLRTILTLKKVSDVVPLPDEVIEVIDNQREAFSTQDEKNVAAIIQARLTDDERAEQEEEARTERYNPFEEDEDK